MADGSIIAGLGPLSPQSDRRVDLPPPSEAKPGKSFAAFLEEQVQEVDTLSKEADTAVADMATGKSNNIHEMMIALDRAEVAFRMVTKVRNKAIDAYHEIMRMSI